MELELFKFTKTREQSIDKEKVRGQYYAIGSAF